MTGETERPAADAKSAAAADASQGPDLLCGRCAVPLSVGKVTASYLGSSFPVELLRCPHCGLTFVPEALAAGKMLQVEQALEEK